MKSDGGETKGVTHIPSYPARLDNATTRKPGDTCIRYVSFG